VKKKSFVERKGQEEIESWINKYLCKFGENRSDSVKAVYFECYFLFDYFNHFLFGDLLEKVFIRFIKDSDCSGRYVKDAFSLSEKKTSVIEIDETILFFSGLENRSDLMVHEMVHHKVEKGKKDIVGHDNEFIAEMQMLGMVYFPLYGFENSYDWDVVKGGLFYYYVEALKEYGWACVLMEDDCDVLVLEKEKADEFHRAYLGRNEKGELVGYSCVLTRLGRKWKKEYVVLLCSVSDALKKWIKDWGEEICARYEKKEDVLKEKYKDMEGGKWKEVIEKEMRDGEIYGCCIDYFREIALGYHEAYGVLWRGKLAFDVSKEFSGPLEEEKILAWVLEYVSMCSLPLELYKEKTESVPFPCRSFYDL